MSDFLLSIVTPVYNRASLLYRCYESLLVQTDGAFEWIVIDDGSSDNIDEVFNRITRESAIRMQLIHKKNGGKHTALNASHPYLNGQYVLILDSDDCLTPEAVSRIHHEWSHYEMNPEIGMLIWQKGKSENDPNCMVKEERIIVDYQSYPRKPIHSRDCCEVIRTELFMQYPFPEFENEKFISEGALWNRASENHKCVYFNEVIYLCDYLEGGLTKSGKKLRISNPNGGMFTSFLRMGKRQRIKEKIKGSVLYSCYGHFAGMNSFDIYNKEKGHSLMKAFGLFPGYVLYKKWKKEYGN